MKQIKTLIILFSIFLLNQKVFSENIMTEFVKDVIIENLKNRVPDPRDPKVYAQIAYDISMGKETRIIEQTFEGLKPENIAKDMKQSAQFFIIKQIAPVVGVYAETALSVYSMVETYVNDWQDWAVQNRMTEFKEDVLSKTTVKELDAAYQNYISGGSDGIGVQNRMLGILYHNRSEVLAKMKEGYELRRKELEAKEKREKLAREQFWAKIRAEEELRNIRKEAEKKTNEIINMMKASKIAITQENFQKYLKNETAYKELKSNYEKEIYSKIDKGEKVQTGDETTDKIITAVYTEKQTLKPAGSQFVAPDYSQLLREYGLNADRLLTNNVSASEYLRVKDLITRSANEIDKSCKEKYINTMTYSSPDIASSARQNYNRCDSYIKKFYDDAFEIDKRLNEYGEKLKKDLKALETDYKLNSDFSDPYFEKIQSDFDKTAKERKLDMCQNIMDSVENDNDYSIDYDHWVKYSWEGKKNPDIKGMEKMRDLAAFIGGSYETLVPIAEQKRKEYLSRLEEIDRIYKTNLEKYNEIYSKNASMIDYFGIPKYDFKKESDLLAFMNKRLGDNYYFINDSYIAKMRRRGGVARKLQEKWNNEIDLNKSFLAKYSNIIEEFKSKAKITAQGQNMEASKKTYEEYQNKYFKNLDKVYCATNILYEHSSIGFENADKAKTSPCYMTIAEHEKLYSEFEKSVMDYAVSDFYSKRDWMYSKTAEMEKAIKESGIKILSAEIEDIISKTNAITYAFTDFARFSKENLYSTLSTYKERIKRMREIEENLKNFACQSSSVEINKSEIEKLPWIVTEEIKKYCLDPKTPKLNTSYDKYTGNYVSEEEAKQIINSLYNDLKNAYESKSASRVLALIDPSWRSPEGEGISDLQEHLNNIFRIFNEIKFNITSLNIKEEEPGIYSVFYNLEMVSRIYSKNIKREEKSSVSEKVKIEKGKAKIIKTDTGSYWMIK